MLLISLLLVAKSSSDDGPIKELSGSAGFSVEKCVQGKVEQQWMLSKDVAPVYIPLLQTFTFLLPFAKLQRIIQNAACPYDRATCICLVPCLYVSLTANEFLTTP